MKKYYSGLGDNGSTGLLGEGRVPKTHPRIQAVGAIDEASAALGLGKAMADAPDLKEMVNKIQIDLYQIMSLVVLETPDPEHFPDLLPDRVTWLEDNINDLQADLPEPRGFILPGDTKSAAAFGLARTIVRRAEREVVNLDLAGLLHSSFALPYINRLSSLCFVLELYCSENYSSAPTSHP